MRQHIFFIEKATLQTYQHHLHTLLQPIQWLRPTLKTIKMNILPQTALINWMICFKANFNENILFVLPTMMFPAIYVWYQHLYINYFFKTKLSVPLQKCAYCGKSIHFGLYTYTQNGDHYYWNSPIVCNICGEQTINTNNSVDNTITIDGLPSMYTCTCVYHLCCYCMKILLLSSLFFHNSNSK